ncbi:hypothetical protein GUJ93_ZPchr0001g33148 [Zizania palustris]|uniref:Uncharacterized protein n=1 Tax=Zizania palustris TaxID=103762 RepID=A0A8J5SC65_ZIZPA|nr:hypothetical protein GUJ93_ZPchr0001g33148 [Zizania palustris]KAG8053051.1 hypothetical protein GUJ93_ZPchr0001g33148 [Zizania palustris]
MSNEANETLKDPSSDNVIPRSSATSVGMELADPNEELSSPSTSIITAQDSFMDSITTDAHQTESPESNSSEGGNIDINNQFMLPLDTSETEISCTSCSDRNFSSILLEEIFGVDEEIFGVDEEALLCNSGKPSDTCTSEDSTLLGRTVSTEEEVILWNPGKPINLHPPESSACNGAIVLGVPVTNGEEQAALYSTNEPEESAKHDVSNRADDPNVWLTDPAEFVDINLQDDQDWMEAYLSSIPQRKNTSFKKKLMRILANKIRWSKERNVNWAVPVRSQEARNVCYQAVSSSDGLDEDWELL